MPVSTVGAPLLRSPPCEVYFAGWKSTTHHLAHAGWQISMDQDMYGHRIRLAIRHPDIQVVGMSAPVEFEFLRRANRLEERESWPIFQINRFSAAIEVRYEKGQIPFTKFQPVECTPHFLEHEVKDIEDLILFTPARVQAKEIIVDEKDVASILADVMKMQEPKQAEIRERVRRERLRVEHAGITLEEVEPHLIHHANILTFARKIA